METAEKKPVPPYVAYKTLSNFVDRFKQGLPGRIDRGLMGSMSGAAQSQVTTALRYLGMISENGLPTQVMRQYATGEEAARRAALELGDYGACGREAHAIKGAAAAVGARGFAELCRLLEAAAEASDAPREAEASALLAQAEAEAARLRAAAVLRAAP